MIKLRGHHLFCTTLFSGSGYSKEFVENMKNIIKRMEREDIEIVSSLDDVCQKCPHAQKDGTCANGNENVLKRDNNALLETKSSVSKIYKHKDLLEKLENLDENSFNNVCKYCQWGELGLCNYKEFRTKLAFYLSKG